MQIQTFVLGPAQTNTYLVADDSCAEAVIIDPAWNDPAFLVAVQKQDWQVNQLWFTHAHFDHIGGAAALVNAFTPPPRIALHPAELALWKTQGNASLFGLRIEPAPEPDILLSPEQVMKIGKLTFEVRHAPGHTPGHVLYYCAAEKVMFCGDLIFAGSIGRTDLPGGDYAALMHSIQTQVLNLPDETRLLPGHGEETEAGWERQWNPFLS